MGENYNDGSIRQSDSYNLGYSNDAGQYVSQSNVPESSISFDMLNVNAQNVNTRYDNKSLCASSLYGSKVSKLFFSIFYKESIKSNFWCCLKLKSLDKLIFPKGIL